MRLISYSSKRLAAWPGQLTPTSSSILQRISPARRAKPDSGPLPVFAPLAQRGSTQWPASPNVRNAQRELFPRRIKVAAWIARLGHMPWTVVMHVLFRSCCISGAVV